MSAWTPKPGDVAKVECSDGEWRRATFVRGSMLTGPDTWLFPNGGRRAVIESHVRPLVIVDPEDRSQVERLVRHMPVEWNLLQSDDPELLDDSIENMQAALRSLIEPPRPDEPGIWGVVEGRDGNRWVREHDGHLGWRHLGPVERSSQWDYIVKAYSPVRVLSEGVTA